MLYTDDMKQRLRRIEGQVSGVLRMMDKGKHCNEVISQLAAIRNAADNAMVHLVATNLEQCVWEKKEAIGDTSKLVEEAVKLLLKSR